jgi:hypothetical protein
VNLYENTFVPVLIVGLFTCVNTYNVVDAEHNVLSLSVLNQKNYPDIASNFIL